MVDEIGYLPLTPAGAMLVLQLMSRSSETASVMVSSSSGLQEWRRLWKQDQGHSPHLRAPNSTSSSRQSQRPPFRVARVFEEKQPCEPIGKLGEERRCPTAAYQRETTSENEIMDETRRQRAATNLLRATS